MGDEAARSSRRARTERALGACAGLALLACETAGFKDAYMALDSQGSRKRDVFYTDTEAIYCVAEMASGVEDVTVIAELRAHTFHDPFTGRPQAARGVKIGAEEQAPGAGDDITVAFRLEKPEGDAAYAAGLFTCDLFLDGQLEASLDFEIQYRDCPFHPIQAQEPCAGFVLYGAECPNPMGGHCTCLADSGVWECG